MRKLAGFLALVLASAASVANAGGTPKAVCIASHERAQVERREKKLRAAREHFVSCARDGCPTAVRKECARLLAEVEASQPTVVFSVKDADGHDTANVRVFFDGAPMLETLTGAAHDADPGDHVFRFVLASGESIEQHGVILEGDKNRKIEVDFSTGKVHPPVAERSEVAPSTAPTPPKPAEKIAIPPVTFVVAGVAVVALGGFAYFAATGKGAEKDLAGSCKPSCTSDQVSPVHRDYLIADVSLAVAAVATVAAVWIAWPSLTQPKTSGLRLGVRPLVGGAGLSAIGTF